MSPALLEREAERAALAAALDRPGGCVLLSGPAGIGKTALLDEVRDRFPRALTARGRAFERTFAFGGVGQLFAGVTVPEASHAAAAFAVEGEPDGFVLHGLTQLLADLGPLAIIVDDAHWLDDQTLRWLTFLLGRDDPATLVLAAEPDERLGTLARHPSTTLVEPRPLSLAAITTITGPDSADSISEASAGNPFAVHAWVAVASGRSGRFDGSGPQAGSAGTSGASRFDATPPPTTSGGTGGRPGRVDAAGPPTTSGGTGGRPGRFDAARSHAIGPVPATAAATRPSAGSVAVLVPPATVAESVVQRLDALGPACVTLARAIAVAGSGGTIAARLAGLDVRSAVEAAEALSASGLLGRDDFTHPLIQDAIADAIPVSERAALHADAARFATGSERIAAHFLAAGPGGGVKAAQALRAAATVAWARGAPKTAVTYLRRASEEELPRTELVPLLRALAHALIVTEGPAGLPALREALALAAPSERAAIVAELGGELTLQGHFAEAADVFARDTEARVALATATVFDHALVRRAGGLDALADSLAPGESAVGEWIAAVRRPRAATSDEGDTPAAAATTSGDAPRTAEPDEGDTPAAAATASGDAPRTAEPDDGDTHTAAAHATGDSHGTPDSADSAVARAAAAAASGTTTPIPAHRQGAATQRDAAAEVLSLLTLVTVGRLEEAERSATAFVDATQARGDLAPLRIGVGVRAMVRVRLGRVAEAEADVRDLLTWTGELGAALPWVAAPFLDALLESGSLDEAQDWVDRNGLEDELPEVLGFGFVLDSLARLRLAQGRLPEALQLARECERRTRAWGIRNPAFLPWGSTLAAAAFATGRVGEALDAADEQVDRATTFGATRELDMGRSAIARITGG